MRDQTPHPRAALLGARTQRFARAALVAAALVPISACGEEPAVGVRVAAVSGPDLDAGAEPSRVRDDAMSWPYCDDPGVTITGVPERACAALDRECVIGVLHAPDPELREEGGVCCTVAARALGVPCGGGEGECSEGVCEQVAQPSDRDRDGVQDASDLVLGDATWVRSELRDLRVFVTDDTVELRVEATPWAWIPLEGQLDLSRVSFDRNIHVGVVAVSAPVERIEVLLPARGTHCLLRGDGGGEEPPGPYFGVDCAEVDGAEKIECPGAGDGWQCTAQDDGTFRLRADDFRQTWIPLGGSFGLHDVYGDGFSPTPARVFPGGWVPELRIEHCDGADEDRDGRIDEGAAFFCNDHRACTEDRCVRGTCQHPAFRTFCGDSALCTADACPPLPPTEEELANPAYRFDSNGCRYQERDFMCDDGAACTQDFCGEPPPHGDDEVIHRQLGGPRHGCTYVAQDDFCADEWDGCTCNGRETCAPWLQATSDLAESQGCMETPPLEYPCEQEEGDENGCTYELCCETVKDSCRVHTALMAQFPALRDHLGESMCSPAVAATMAGDLGAAAPFVGLASHPTTRTIAPDTQCAIDGNRHPVPYGNHCEDENPCTTDEACIAPSGACEATRLGGPQAGCDGRVIISNSDGWTYSTCLSWTCHVGTCAPRPEAGCDDGAFCNGREVCSLERAVPAGFHVAPVTDEERVWSPRGCGVDAPACDDRVGCTVDTCNEATDSCSAVPTDVVCAGADFDPCARDVACDPGAPPGSSGCVAIEPRNPCLDSNICTTDICNPREFEDFTCEQTRNPYCVELDREDLYERPRFELPPPSWQP